MKAALLHNFVAEVCKNDTLYSGFKNSGTKFRLGSDRSSVSFSGPESTPIHACLTKPHLAVLGEPPGDGVEGTASLAELASKRLQIAKIVLDG